MLLITKKVRFELKTQSIEHSIGSGGHAEHYTPHVDGVDEVAAVDACNQSVGVVF